MRQLKAIVTTACLLLALLVLLAVTNTEARSRSDSRTYSSYKRSYRSIYYTTQSPSSRRNVTCSKVDIDLSCPANKLCVSQVKVCTDEAGRTTKIFPLAILKLNPVYATVYSSAVTAKSYARFKVQLTSQEIRKAVEDAPDLGDYDAAFPNITKCRFLAINNTGRKLPEDTGLIEQWQKVDSSSDEDVYVNLEFYSSSEKRMKELRDDILSGDNRNPGEVVTEVVKMQCKVFCSFCNKFKTVNLSLATEVTTSNAIQLLGLKKVGDTNLNYLVMREHKNLMLPAVVGKNWFLIQKRESIVKRFTENDWDAYKWGFGDISGYQFWLGLERIHEMTKTGGYGLRIEFIDSKNEEKFAEWENFSVESEADNYRLRLGGFLKSSTASDDALAPAADGASFYCTYGRKHEWNCRTYRYRGCWWTKDTSNCEIFHLNACKDDDYKKKTRMFLVKN